MEITDDGHGGSFVVRRRRRSKSNGFAGAVILILLVLGMLEQLFSFLMHHLIVLFLVTSGLLAFCIWGMKVRANRKKDIERNMQQRKIMLAKSGIEDIDTMSGWDFETRMRIHFEMMGWQVLQTPGSGDYGADLVLTSPDGRKIVAQLKRYLGPVGISAIEDVLRSMPVYGAVGAMLITNSHLTKGAGTFAQRHSVEVWERESLIRHLLDSKREIEAQMEVAATTVTD